MNNAHLTKLTVFFTALMLVASACAGGEVTLTEAATTLESSSEPADAAATAEPIAPTAAPEPTAVPDEPAVVPTEVPEPAATAAPEPTPTTSPLDGLPVGEPLTFLPSTPGDLDTVAAAADLWAASWRTDADPSQVAQEIIGFPFDLPAPVDGQIFNLLSETSYDEDDGVWETRWRYGLEATEFPELMASDEDKPIGPAVDVMYNETVPRYIASGLVLQNTANTPSDRHPSGMGSFQIYFRPEDTFAVPAAGLDGELDTMQVLMSVNVDGNDDIDGDVAEPGYYVGGSAVFAEAPAGMPLVGAVHELLNMPSSMTMTRGRVVSDFADPAVEGENGTPTVTLSMTYEGPASEFDSVIAALAEPAGDLSELAYGSIVDGALEPDTFEVSLTNASTDLLLVNRHEGRMSAWVPDPEDELFELTVRFTLATTDE